MARIKNINFGDKEIRFDFKNNLDVQNLNLSKDYNFIELNNFKSKIKLVKRGKNESTLYFLINKELRERLFIKFNVLFNTKKIIYLKSNLIEQNNKKYLIIEL